MMHSRIEDEEIIERYARNQLSPEEKLEFEEHFFACDECFDRLLDTERFIAGVRDAASRRELRGDLLGAEARPRGWLIPAFVVTAALTLALAATTAWLSFAEIPGLRRQIAQTSADLHAQSEANASLAAQSGRASGPEPNVPLVMLQSTREIRGAATETKVPASAQQIILWFELPAGKPSQYSVTISDAKGNTLEAIDHLTRNSYGALAASIPARTLPPGEFSIRVTAQDSPATLIGEYRIKIVRP